MSDGERLRQLAKSRTTTAEERKALTRASFLLDAEDERARQARQEEDTKKMRIPEEGTP